MMPMNFTKCSRAQAVAFAALLLATSAGAVASLTTATPVAANPASAKVVVDTAKARGEVGEQGDGFLGFVTQSRDPVTTSAVAEINAGRAEAYRDVAAKTGVTVEAAGEATARQLLAKMPPGQFYKPLNGTWTKK